MNMHGLTKQKSYSDFLGYILVFSWQAIYDGGLLADTVDHFLFSFK